MFGNQFDSFHNTVAEAKKEREQLNKLLTISTPKERVLVIVIGVTILVLAAWLLFGQVPMSISVAGEFNVPHEYADEPDMPGLEMVTVRSDWLTSEDIRHVTPALPANIGILMSNGEQVSLKAEVLSITSLHDAISEPTLQQRLGRNFHQVVLTLTEPHDQAILHKQECEIQLLLGKRSVASLFLLN